MISSPWWSHCYTLYGGEVALSKWPPSQAAVLSSCCSTRHNQAQGRSIVVELMGDEGVGKGVPGPLITGGLIGLERIF